MKIVFMGTPEFGAVILGKLCESEYRPVLVITEPDRPVGRKQVITPPPVKIMAQKYNIPVAQPEKIENYRLEIENYRPDLIIIAAYGQILPKEILDIPKYNCLNVHPSLLPKWRGPSPIQYAILNGDKVSGVTIMLVDQKMDHGGILNQRSIIIDKEETGKTLHDKLADLGASLLLETVSRWLRGLVKSIPQDESKVSFSKILVRESGRINWKKSAEDLERQIRAFNMWPESFTFWQKAGKLLRIKILKARIKKTTGNISYSIGKTLVAPQNELCVQCGGGFSGKNGDFLVIERLQLEGKKEMGSDEFIRGQPDFIGTILC